MFLTLAVFLEAFFADFTVFPTIFAFSAFFAEVNPGAIRTGPAIIAHEFTAVDAMLAFVGALTHVGVAVAAFRTMISAAFGVRLADSAGFAKLNALAERAFAAFRTEEFLVAIDTMLAAIAAALAVQTGGMDMDRKHRRRKRYQHNNCKKERRYLFFIIVSSFKIISSLKYKYTYPILL